MNKKKTIQEIAKYIGEDCEKQGIQNNTCFDVPGRTCDKCKTALATAEKIYNAIFLPSDEVRKETADEIFHIIGDQFVPVSTFSDNCTKMIKFKDLEWFKAICDNYILGGNCTIPYIPTAAQDNASQTIQAQSDPVNHPSHYTSGKYETIDIIQDKLTAEQFEGYCIGNVIKYITRYQHKNGLEDLKKAFWYLRKIIEVKGGKAEWKVL